MLLRELSICLFFAISAIALEPYCDHSITEEVEVPVLKTRMKIVPRKGFWNKMLKKKDAVIENFVVMEKKAIHKTRSGCCDGYAKSELNICEPVCDKGCPKNADCVEPNVCKCNKGYILQISKINGSHSCEPICSSGCHMYAVCSEPDSCVCKKGYHDVGGECVPRCRKGHVFKEGTCIPCFAQEDCCSQLDYCLCSGESVWNPHTKICDENVSIETSTNENVGTTEDDFFEGFDSDVFSTPASDSTDNDDDMTTESECPEGFILFQHKCRPLTFASNEDDCRFIPCTENAVCQDNGTCTCMQGFVKYSPSFESEVTESILNEAKFSCLTLGDFEARTSDNLEDDGYNWTVALYIALAIILLSSTIIFLIVKLMFVRRGGLNVEAQNDLYSCNYNSNEKTVL